MIQIITISDSFKHYETPILEFQKRLGKKVQFTKIKPSKKQAKDEVIKEETEKLIPILTKAKGYKVLLFIEGKNLDSIQFQKYIQEKEMNFGSVVFVIGGAFGVDFETIKNLIDDTFSFSKMTFPHSLALLVLYEQIYRADCIQKGKQYHK